ncbi:hypothetical protein Tco_1419162 [Tanacetum coccineum]
MGFMVFVHGGLQRSGDDAMILKESLMMLSFTGGEWKSLVDLPLNESRSSQWSGLGSGIPSLVGAFGSKVIKCGTGSSLSTSSASREGDRGDPDFRSLLYGGRGAHSLPLNDEAGSGRRDLNPQSQPWQGYALPINLFPPATLHESARNQLILEPFIFFHGRAISFLLVGLCHPLEQVREPRVNEVKEPHDWIVHRLCIWMCIKKGRGRGREREEAAVAPHELLTGALREKLPPKETTCVFLRYSQSGYRRYDVKSKRLDLCSASSADCQPVHLTSEDSSHPAHHVYSQQRLQSLSQGQTTP